MLHERLNHSAEALDAQPELLCVVVPRGGGRIDLPQELVLEPPCVVRRHLESLKPADAQATPRTVPPLPPSPPKHRQDPSGAARQLQRHPGQVKGGSLSNVTPSRPLFAPTRSLPPFSWCSLLHGSQCRCFQHPRAPQPHAPPAFDGLMAQTCRHQVLHHFLGRRDAVVFPALPAPALHALILSKLPALTLPALQATTVDG